MSSQIHASTTVGFKDIPTGDVSPREERSSRTKAIIDSLSQDFVSFLASNKRTTTLKQVLKSWGGLLLLVTTVASIALGTYQMFYYEMKVRDVYRQKQYANMVPYAAQIEHQLKLAVTSTYSLAVLLQVDQHNAVVDNFEVIASTLLNNFECITNMQLAPKGVVSQIVPLAGNEGAIGHKLLDDSILYNRRDESIESIESRKVTFVGPFKLLQGGVAVIARYPVFTSYGGLPEWPGPMFAGEDTTFWGFATMLSLVDDLFVNVDLQHLEDSTGLKYHIRNLKHSEGPESDAGIFYPLPIAGSNLLNDELTIDIEYPEANVHWALEASPVGGWPTFQPDFWFQAFFAVSLTGAIFTINVGILANRMKNLNLSKELEFTVEVVKLERAKSQSLSKMNLHHSDSPRDDDDEKDEREIQGAGRADVMGDV
jgi:sensor domain CHASE-containing protein